MTPMLVNAKINEVLLSDIDRVTIVLIICVCKKNKILTIAIVFTEIIVMILFKKCYKFKSIIKIRSI